MPPRWSPAAPRIGLLLLVMGLVGCAETTLTVDTAKSLAALTPDPQRSGEYKVGRPYTIDGRTYVPREDFAYDEIGIASWYGPGFHGNTTANGERFDQNALTAAHRTLPMPSLIRVTNLENGRRVDLRVNDRGPFADDRIVDVSKRAAQVLGFKDDGIARVRVVILPEESLALRDGRPLPTGRSSGEGIRVASAGTAFVPALPTTAPTTAPTTVPTTGMGSGPWFIQAGAFGDPDNARQVVGHLAAVAPAHLSPFSHHGHSLVRVRIGPVRDGQHAVRLLRAVQASGYPEARLIMD